MNSQLAEKLLSEYESKYSKYEHFSEDIHSLVNNILFANGLKIHSVFCRTKDKESLKQKLFKTESNYAKLNDKTDLCGIRIITHFEDDVDKIAAIIENEFEIDFMNSIDKRKSLAPDRFGYLSLHYVVELGNDRKELVEYKRYKGMKFEIQVRSILQHAWAEIEHDLGYKTIEGIPDEVRRRFSRLAGLLEIADQEFLAIRNELADYTSTVSERILKSPEDVSLNKDSLVALYFSDDNIIKPIDTKISEATGIPVYKTIGLANTRLNAYMELRLPELFYIGIGTIAELESALRRNKEIIVKLAVKILDSNRDGIPAGISLLYLYYAYISSTDLDRAVQGLSASHGGKDIKFAKRLLDAHNSISK